MPDTAHVHGMTMSFQAPSRPPTLHHGCSPTDGRAGHCPAPPWSRSHPPRRPPATTSLHRRNERGRTGEHGVSAFCPQSIGGPCRAGKALVDSEITAPESPYRGASSATAGSTRFGGPCGSHGRPACAEAARPAGCRRCGARNALPHQAAFAPSGTGPLTGQVRVSCAQRAMPPSLAAAIPLSPVRTGCSTS